MNTEFECSLGVEAEWQGMVAWSVADLIERAEIWWR